MSESVNKTPLLFSEALRRPTLHDFVGLVEAITEFEGREELCFLARFRCRESGAVRTYGVYEKDNETLSLFNGNKGGPYAN